MAKETSWSKVDRGVLVEPPKKRPPQSIVQDWVMCLGLRLQGVLISAVRGCDTAERHDNSKVLARIFRGEILRTHIGDASKCKSFILVATIPDTVKRMQDLLNDCDHYPQHYVMHFIHAAEILGYCHPEPEKRDLWHNFYQVACRKYHLRPETQSEMLARLEEDDEDTFHKNQDTTVTATLWEANEERKKQALEQEQKAKRDAEARKRQESQHGVYGGS